VFKAAQSLCDRLISFESNYFLKTYSGGKCIGRPRKNKAGLTGRAGRRAIEQEDLARESQRWQRRKAMVKIFLGNI
jgi:hypothetical protein